MKIQCDACEKHEASLFCVADEAALCPACDYHIHHANKVAGKHLRLSLHHPSPEQAPLCDICQERRAFIFCQQDRAILCRQCDVPIHIANEHTQKHVRFLLTGTQLSANPTIHEPSKGTLRTAKGTTTQCTSTQSFSNTHILSFVDGSSIPGWHVEDFLDSSHGLSKNRENEKSPAFWEHADYFQRSPTEKMGITDFNNSFAVPRIKPHSTSFFH